MGKTIELELSDALYAQVSTEAEACGQGLFGYIRAKLATREGPTRRPDVIREADQERPSALNKRRVPVEYDQDGNTLPPRDARHMPTHAGAPMDPGAFAEARISRIEQAIDGLTAFLTQQYAAANQPAEPQPPQPIDLDSMVDTAAAQAEAEGRTEYVPDPVREVMHVAGVRPLAKRPTPFAAGNQPRHLHGL